MQVRILYNFSVQGVTNFVVDHHVVPLPLENKVILITIFLQPEINVT